jgi:predicted aspartyl protease
VRPATDIGRATAPSPRGAARAWPLVYDEQGALLIEVAIAGLARPRLLLDTGASVSTLSRACAQQLGLALRRGESVEGSAGVVAAEGATAAITIPGIGLRRVDVAVYDFSSHDPDCVGILGNDVLSERPFRLAYRPARLEWDGEEPAATLPLDLDQGIPRISIGVGGTAIDVRLDTGAALAPGAEVYLNLTRRQAAELGLSGAPSAVFTATGTGGARLELPVHRVRDVAIGAVRFDAAFAIVQPAVGYFARDEAVGFLGNSVLDKLDPWFDYAGGRFAATRG